MPTPAATGAAHRRQRPWPGREQSGAGPQRSRGAAAADQRCDEWRWGAVRDKWRFFRPSVLFGFDVFRCDEVLPICRIQAVEMRRSTKDAVGSIHAAVAKPFETRTSSRQPVSLRQMDARRGMSASAVSASRQLRSRYSLPAERPEVASTWPLSYPHKFSPLAFTQRAE